MDDISKLESGRLGAALDAAGGHDAMLRRPRAAINDAVGPARDATPAAANEGDATPGLPADLLADGGAALQVSDAASELLFDYLCSLRKHLPHLSADETPHVIQATNSLMRAGWRALPDAARDEARPPPNTVLFQRVQRYIDSNLASPDLTPERICKDVGISRSKLYQLFAPLGGVMRVVQRQRLARIRAILADPARPRMRIAEIAWCHGFVSEKHFSRVFKAEFGHTPRETLERVRCAGA
jgi:AraC-like DNA-binding protein